MEQPVPYDAILPQEIGTVKQNQKESSFTNRADPASWEDPPEPGKMHEGG